MPIRRDSHALTSGADAPTGWVATWAAAPTSVPREDPTMLDRQTVRHVVHCSLGGDELRVRLTNEFGGTALHIGAAHVAVRAGTGGSTETVPGTDRRITFGGHGDVTIPAGSPLDSDPVRLCLLPGTDLAISLYLPGQTPVATLAAFAFQDNVIANGDVTADRTVTPVATVTQNLFLSGVAVRARGSALVALGDSITNGMHTPNNLNRRWPDLFAVRLRAAGLDLGIANVGIGGNRLLYDANAFAGSAMEPSASYFGDSALHRFDQDVLAQPGRKYLVVQLGVNDLGQPGTFAPASEAVSADDLIAGHRHLIARARKAGLLAYGATTLPFKGDIYGMHTEQNERIRSAVNDWIRTAGEYDAVIDFDAALSDPADPMRLNPAYDSGDHLHPNEAGMAALAAAVPLRLFR